MSKKMKVETRKKLEVVPFQKKHVRAIWLSEGAKNHGASDSAVQTVQEAVLRGYAAEIAIHGTDKDGRVRQSFRMRVDNNDEGEIFLENDGRKTVAERIDPSLARALAHSKTGFEKRGLMADTRIILRDEINNDPERRQRAFKELDLEEGAALRYRDGEEPVEVLKITPAKDRGMTAIVETSRRKR